MFFTTLFIFVFAGLPIILLASLSLYIMYQLGKYVLQHAEKIPGKTEKLMENKGAFSNVHA